MCWNKNWWKLSSVWICEWTGTSDLIKIFLINSSPFVKYENHILLGFQVSDCMLVWLMHFIVRISAFCKSRSFSYLSQWDERGDFWQKERKNLISGEGTFCHYLMEIYSKLSNLYLTLPEISYMADHNLYSLQARDKPQPTFHSIHMTPCTIHSR